MDKGNAYGSRFGAADKDIRFHLLHHSFYRHGNSLYQGERVLVNKWSYGFRVPFPLGDGWKTGRERGYRVIQ